MSLSREARGLVDAARREAGGPNPDQRSRMRRVVMAAVSTGAVAGATATTGTAAAAIATGSSLGLVGKVGIGLAMIGLAGGGAVWVSQRGDAPAPAVSVAVTSAMAIPIVSARSASPAPEMPREAIAIVSASASTTPRAEPQRVAPAANDDLAEELGFLRSARSALGAGNSSEALASLDQYVARFPNGKLGFEQRALRAMALCKAGRMEEGRALSGAIAEASPGSPLSERVAAACE
jgi:hypothetical protein